MNNTMVWFIHVFWGFICATIADEIANKMNEIRGEYSIIENIIMGIIVGTITWHFCNRKGSKKKR